MHGHMNLKFVEMLLPSSERPTWSLELSRAELRGCSLGVTRFLALSELNGCVIGRSRLPVCLRISSLELSVSVWVLHVVDRIPSFQQYLSGVLLLSQTRDITTRPFRNDLFPPSCEATVIAELFVLWLVLLHLVQATAGFRNVVLLWCRVSVTVVKVLINIMAKPT